MSEGIHEIGAAAVAALKALNQAKAAKKAKAAKATELIEERNEIVRPLLKQVHDHIAGGGAVNGHTTWAGWAKYAGWSKRALNYILNGRKPQGGNSSSRSTAIKDGVLVNVGGEVYRIEGEIRTRATKGDRLVFSFTAIEASRAQKLAQPEPKKSAKPVDPKKELVKRYRLAKRAAKFFNGMMKEYHVMDRHGSAARFEQLRDLYDNNDGHGGENIYPWTPPTQGYCLPKTYKEFQTQYDAAIAEFDAVMKEGMAAGVLTLGTREHAVVGKPVPDVVSETESKHFTHDAKEIVTITHAYGGASAGGGQFTRMYSFALCGRRFTPNSETHGMTIPASGRIHKSVLRGETPSCPKCLELLKQKLSEPAKALAATVESATIPQHMKDVIERQKRNIAAGIDPHGSECPTQEEEVL